MEHLKDMGITTLELDVTKAEAIKRVKEQIATSTGGTLDILFNNAGQNSPAPAIDMDMNRVRDLFEVNLFSVMAMVKEFVPLLIASGNGLIVQTGSITSVAPIAFQVSYNATKAALAAYTDTLRIELAPFNIHVMHLTAGGVRSNMLTKLEVIDIPENSLYAPAEPLFQKRRQDSIKGEMTEPDVFARIVVTECLKAEPRAWFWTASHSTMIWFVDTFLPRSAWDYLVGKVSGLREAAPLLSAAQRRYA